jgi:DNA-3-methyladenine glycosylase
VIERAFFARPVLEVARDLVGCGLYVDGVGGPIVELEAYHREDPASHAYLNRRTRRNAAMFLPGGHAYVYRSYGIHWCLNLVCAGEDEADAVLVRALEPARGLDRMRARRGVDDERALCSGPGKLCQALGVDRRHDGLPLDAPPFELLPRASEPEIAAGPRIGISRATELPWRFGVAGSRFLSRPLRSG